jgi:hypothetical protein
MSYSSSVQGIGLLLSLGSSILPGCTDTTAFNYNPAATIDDGSCIAVVNGCMDPTANNYNVITNVDNGSCTWAGCTDPTAFNYNSVIVANANTYGTTATNDGSCIAVVNGCTNPTAFNYNSSANNDDGSCIAVVNGCTNPLAFNYNALANIDDGSCVAVVNGCTNITACNYNALANTDDGSCTYPPSNANCAGQCLTGYISVGGVCVAIVTGCTDSTSLNYNAAANIDDGSCIAVVNGCTDATATNYNAAANTDDGSCTYLVCTGTAPITGNYVNTTTNTAAIHWDDMNTGVCVVEWYQVRYRISGPSAWTPLSTTITNSQNITNLIPGYTYLYEMKMKYVGFPLLDWSDNPSGTFTTLSCPSGTVLLNGGCVPAVNGCMDPSACNYNPAANVITWPTGCIYAATNANCAGNCLTGYTSIGGVCVAIINGCTNPTSFNYNALATIDDGSCIAVVNGCMDPTATNYNAAANTNNGTCTYTLCHIPDSNFRAALVAGTNQGVPLGITNSDWVDSLGTPNVNGEYINIILVNTITNLYVDNQNIADLTGIECFTALTELRCDDNQLTSLDVSQNTALTNLFCQKNQLTSLDVSANIALIRLLCGENQLTGLNVNTNTSLKQLFVNLNLITSLDVSQNTALTHLNCHNNQLTDLDVSANTNLGVLQCGSNQLPSLNVSQNTALTSLSCGFNQLTSLDVSQNGILVKLYCGDNQITTLNVSGNIALTSLDCNQNQLTVLDIANGAIPNCGVAPFQVYYFNATGNPPLHLIHSFQSGNYVGCVPAGSTFNPA